MCVTVCVYGMATSSTRVVMVSGGGGAGGGWRRFGILTCCTSLQRNVCVCVCDL